MSVIAFIQNPNALASVAEYAAWAARQMDEAIRFVALSPNAEQEPVLDTDAYQIMDTQEDMFRELVSSERRQVTREEPWGVEQVQTAARFARELGVERVSTDISDESFASYVEHHTDSTDLLVIGGRGSRRDLTAAMQVRKRVFLVVPGRFASIDSWMMAYSNDAGSGRAVEFLTSHTLLRDKAGIAAIGGGDEPARMHFRDAMEHLTSAGHTIRQYELQGNADDVLAAVLTVLPIDLLVVGVSSAERFRTLWDRSKALRLASAYHGPILLARS
ncbi:MAG: hypothetical protein KC435_06660 [Thermomicrobiales bacterium]|nr:hypothetical protein [Thermomicrobiales bacterium]